jgi:hypothetical protein
LDLKDNIYGIYIPEDEILIRPKYQWFAALNIDQILETKSFLTTHIKASMLDALTIYREKKGGRDEHPISI